MSLLRLSRPGYPTQLILQDPAHAEVQGRGGGGAAIGYWSGTTLTVKQKRDNGPRKRLARAPLGRPSQDQPRCGVQTRFGDPCGRLTGHQPPHKSREAVARIASKMRGAA